jgi:hypothetical protein
VNRALVVAAVLVSAAGPLAAQDSAAAELRQARALYDQLELERAVRLLRGILAPGRATTVATDTRVQAYQYLGAAQVLLGKPDSAVASFRAALERDPFLDLPPDEFTPAQVGAFTRARRESFAVAVRPVAAARVDPRTERLRFPFATTHAANVKAELRRLDTIVTTFEVGSQGPGELVWDGLAGGRLVPPGRYELRVHATSRLMQRTDSAATYFTLRYEIPALEDTLRTLTPADLLPERTSASAGFKELGKGAAVAGGVLVIAGPLSDGALGRGDGARPAIVASVAMVAGIVAFIAQRKTREIPANVAANRERRELWQAMGDSIRARNAERVSAAVLVVAPAAGVGP